MIRLPPRSTGPDTLFPYTTLCRSRGLQKDDLIGSAPCRRVKSASNKPVQAMKINANTIRPGMVIDHDGRQWAVMKIQLIQPGKGGAFIQVEMRDVRTRSEEHTSELQSLMRISYAVFCLKKKKKLIKIQLRNHIHNRNSDKTK